MLIVERFFMTYREDEYGRLQSGQARHDLWTSVPLVRTSCLSLASLQFSRERLSLRVVSVSAMVPSQIAQVESY